TSFFLYHHLDLGRKVCVCASEPPSLPVMIQIIPYFTTFRNMLWNTLSISALSELFFPSRRRRRRIGQARADARVFQVSSQRPWLAFRFPHGLVSCVASRQR
ncbi:unnamed protein product, partial [Mycena citricolor]